MFLHEAISGALHTDDHALKAPLSVRLMARVPLLRRIPGRLVGMGVRPEHVHSPEIRAEAGHGRGVAGVAPCEASV
jgi:hypothetical protein